MTRPQAVAQVPYLILDARCAADVMLPSPVSLRAQSTIADAINLFTLKSVSAAPVIDDTGRPVGVVSRGDILTHERERSQAGDDAGRPDRARVGDIMTPAIFSVTPSSSIHSVVEQMLTLHVQQLYVVDENQLLVGVITASSILQRLRPLQEEPA